MSYQEFPSLRIFIMDTQFILGLTVIFLIFIKCGHFVFTYIRQQQDKE